MWHGACVGVVARLGYYRQVPEMIFNLARTMKIQCILVNVYLVCTKVVLLFFGIFSYCYGILNIQI